MGAWGWGYVLALAEKLDWESLVVCCRIFHIFSLTNTPMGRCLMGDAIANKLQYKNVHVGNLKKYFRQREPALIEREWGSRTCPLLNYLMKKRSKCNGDPSIWPPPPQRIEGWDFPSNYKCIEFFPIRADNRGLSTWWYLRWTGGYNNTADCFHIIFNQVPKMTI